MTAPISQTFNQISNQTAEQHTTQEELEPIATASKDKIRRSESFAHFLQKIGGNADLEHAKIIFLGEKHDELVHLLQIGDFLEENAQEGDMLLVEGASIGEVVSPEDENRKRYFRIPTSSHASALTPFKTSSSVRIKDKVISIDRYPLR